MYCYSELTSVQMSRSDGLHQRRNVAQASGGASAKDDSDSEDKSRRRQGGDSDESGDDDGKNTRLTLMEECLLLGLKDKEVSSFL
jgi:Golgi phosphoprotein 3